MIDLDEQLEEGIEQDEIYQNLQAKTKENLIESLSKGYSLNEKGFLLYKDRMYVPNVPKVPKVKLIILDEIHKTPYSGHLGYQKTITMLRKEYFWPNMKTELAEYIARWFECQQVKIEHQHPAGLLQSLPIPSWKWEIISLDFVTRLPRNQNLNDFIMVLVDKLSKAAYFIPVKTTYKAANIADIFLK